MTVLNNLSRGQAGPADQEEKPLDRRPEEIAPRPVAAEPDLEPTALLRRVTLVTEAVYEKMVLDQLERLEADAYTCMYCSGKRLHEPYENPLLRRSLVRIEVLARPTVVRSLLTILRRWQAANYPVSAVFDMVSVSV